LILRIRNFVKYQGAIKRDWPYRKIQRAESGAYANLPAYVRGIAMHLVRVADAPDGDIECGDHSPGLVVRRRIGGHYEERHLISKAVDRLLAEGFIIRIEHDAQVAAGASVGLPQVVGGSPVGHPQVTCGSSVGNPWVAAEIPSVGNDSTAESQVSKKVSNKRPKKTALLERWQIQAQEIWDLQEQLRGMNIPGARPLRATTERLIRIAERLESGATREDCEHVLRVYALDAARGPEQARWFNGETNWRPENFDRALGRPLAAAAAAAADPMADIHAAIEAREAGR